MKNTLIIIVVVCSFVSNVVNAAVMSASDAKQMVQGWLSQGNTHLGVELGTSIDTIDTYSGKDKVPIYHIVNLAPSGFIIVSADDEVEPIIAFSENGKYDLTTDNPLASLADKDLRQRTSYVRNRVKSKSSTENEQYFAEMQSKWKSISAIIVSKASNGTTDSDMDEILVEPLLKTEWDQTEAGGNLCYNYYTPNNYPCGCVATAMAQIMYYHQYPIDSIGAVSSSITIDGITETRTTIGGDGVGGQYNWGAMQTTPNYYTSETSRKAIGALCYDAGVSVGMSYTASGSGANTLNAGDAFLDVFKYSNAIKGGNQNGIDKANLDKILISNLFATYPVMLGIDGNDGGHAIVADGYGIDNSTDLYHLNMGWTGLYNLWYNLPNIYTDLYASNIVHKCVYNIYHIGTGEIVSGRIYDLEGTPAGGVTINIGNKIIGTDQFEVIDTVTSDNNGIYSFSQVPGNRNYYVYIEDQGSIEAQDQAISLGMSSGYNTANLYNIDFYVDAKAKISVLGNDQVIANKDDTPSVYDNTDFSTFNGIITKEFVIKNDGNIPLEVSVQLASDSEFSISYLPDSVVAPGGYTTFDVTLDIGTDDFGFYQDRVIIASNDPNNLAYYFEISGYASNNDGTAEDPFQISTSQQLCALHNLPELYNSHFILMQDIDMDGYIFDSAVISPNTKDGSYFYGVEFSGLFDGNFHKISNLKIDGQDYCGLFGYIEKTAIIRNLGLENIDITCSGCYAGGLVGYCCAKGDSNTVSISNCYATGLISGDNGTGGLVGYCCTNSDRSAVSISNCYATELISGDNDTGGLVGYCYTRYNSSVIISNCYATGQVTGGVAGGLVGYCRIYNESGVISIGSCYATGQVTGSYTGGLVGGCFINESSSVFSISNCYATGQVTGYSAGGLAGDCSCGANNVVSITDSYATGQVTGGGGVAGGLVGNVSVYDLIVASISNCYATGSVTGTGGHVGGLVGCNNGEISNCHASGSITGEGWYTGGLVGQNIGSVNLCYATGSVTGTGGHVGGLVGCNNGEISNCHASGSITGEGWYTGGLVGQNIGSVNLCYATGSVTGESCLGGLVGYNDHDSIVSSCYAIGSVTAIGDDSGGLVGVNSGAISNSFSTGSVTGDEKIGGLVGRNYDGSIICCYALGYIKGYDYIGGLVGYNRDSRILGCFSGCRVTATKTGAPEYIHVGGLVGYNYVSSSAGTSSISIVGDIGVLETTEANISDCFWDVEVSGIGLSGDDNYGAVGKNTAEMMDASTFAGWDIGDTDGDGEGWKLTENYYPRFIWEPDSFSPDINGDSNINILDLGAIASMWLCSDCASIYYCGQTDFNVSGSTDMEDFLIFVDSWLE